MKDIDVSKEDEKQKVFDMLGAGVLHNLAVSVKIEGDIEEDSAVAAFIDELRLLPNLHFQAAAAAGA